jgi:hypothetical protein
MNPPTSKLSRRDDEAEPIGTSAQCPVERHQAAAEDLSQRDVLGVVGPPPAELLGDLPGRPPKVWVVDPANGADFKMLMLESRVLSADLSIQQAEVQGRASLGPHQSRSNEILVSQRLETIGRADRGDGDGGIDDEGQRRPRRASCSSATQFGCGVPSSKVFHSSGSPTMSSSASGSSTTMIRALEIWGSLRASTSRCSCSRVAMPASLAAIPTASANSTGRQ